MPPSSSAPPTVWDIFCRVVDNYGDIGVCWRLARQLAREQGFLVRLWVDDPSALQRLAGGLPLSALNSNELKVFEWSMGESEEHPGDVVIEAFACELPQAFVARMACKELPPLWINLEYLSAEAWIEACHGLPSPHPSLKLRKFFFFPGFSPGTGGLLREGDLMARRDAFQGRAQDIQAWWESLGGNTSWRARLNLSLFTYEVADMADWLAALATGERAVRLLVPEGRALAQVAAWFGEAHPRPGQAWQRGQLDCHVLPFVPQDDYDKLLWACDFNLVRGEDSFVRAQWAAKPFLWHIYPQEDRAHEAKLRAFTGRYLAAMEPSTARALEAFWLAWNGSGALAKTWATLEKQLPMAGDPARAWAGALAGQADLVANLVQFYKETVK